MAKGPLRLALEDFASTSLPPQGGPGWWDRVKARWTEYEGVFHEYVTNHLKETTLPSILLMHWMGIMYALFGSQNTINTLRGKAPKTPVTDVSEMIAGALNSAFSQPFVKEIAESLGTIITEPVLALFEQYAEKDNPDPREFARTFHGIMIGLNVGGGLADTFLETITAGQVEGAGRLLQSVYWSLGLGFLGWQTLAPLLNSGLQPGLERYYQRLYHPKRFSASELRDLYALGEIDPGTLKSEAETLGWRPQDIEKWIKLAFRTLPEGDIWNGLHEGFLTEDQAKSRLRALGYDPNDIPLLFKLNPKKDTSEAKNFTVANARAAFKKNLIGEAELRKILETLKYSAREIELIIAIDRQSMAQDDRLLSADQVKEAWRENVLSDQEATHWLTTYGFASEQADILLRTWRAELVPDFRKLNSGTIEGAYVEGILTRAQAKDKLISVGFAAEDADLELNLVEARNPESFGRPLPVKSKVLTAGALSELVAVGLLTPAQMRDRLVALGYTTSDAGLLSEAARLSAIPLVRQLPQRTIEDAFFAGVLTRAQAIDRLKEIGFTDRDAGLVIDTVQKQLDAVAEAKAEAQRKRLGPASLEDLVIAGIITADEMRRRLTDLGYSAVDAGLLTDRAVQLATAPPRLLNQANISNAYLFGVLARDQAKERLIKLDFTPEDAETILTTLEKANPDVFNPDLSQAVRLPTIGALVAAVQNGIISDDEYFAKTAELGYRPEDARMYLQIATKTEKKSTRPLTTSQLIAAYGAGFMPYGVVLNRLTSNGYSTEDAILLIRLEKDLIVNSDAWHALLDGQIDPFEAIAELVNQAYSDKDILDAFAALGPATLAQMEINLTDLAEALHATPGGE